MLFLHAKHQIKNKWSQQKNTTTQAHRATQIMQLYNLCNLCNLFKEDCPMNGLCLTLSILYQATIQWNEAILNANKKDAKEPVKRHSRNIMETTINHLT